jgi:hypothetical protein
MDENGQVHCAQPPDQPVQARQVVEVAVAADDDLDAGRVDVKAAHVLHDTVGACPGIEKDPVLAAVLGHGHQHREAVLGEQRLGGLASLHGRHGAPVRRHHGRPARGPLVGHEDVGHVVHQRRHDDRVDRFKIEDRRGLHLVQDLLAVAVVSRRVVSAHRTIMDHDASPLDRQAAAARGGSSAC